MQRSASKLNDLLNESALQACGNWLKSVSLPQTQPSMCPLLEAQLWPSTWGAMAQSK